MKYIFIIFFYEIVRYNLIVLFDYLVSKGQDD
jgi:hypothetical protein